MGIVLVPFMIGRLGKEEYGLFQFTQTFVIYLPLLTLSAGTGLNRYLTGAVAGGDPVAVRRTLSTGFAVLLVMALVLALAGGGLVVLLPHLWPSLGEGAGRAQGLLLLLSIGLAVQTLAGVFRATLFAKERVGEADLIGSSSNVVRAAVIVWAFHAFEASLLWIGVATLLGFLAQAAAEAFFARRSFEGFSISLRGIDPRAGRELLSFSAVATLGGLTHALLLMSDNFLIQFLFGAAGPERIAVYSVAAMWGPQLRGFMMRLSGIVVPRMTMMAVRGSDAELRDLTVLSVRYTSGLVLLPCLLAGIFAGPLLEAWLVDTLTPEDLAIAPLVLQWTLLTVFLQSSINPTYGMFYARGRLGAPVVASGVMAAVKITASLLLAGPLGFGLPGIAAGTVLAVAISQIFVRPWLVQREIGLPARRLLVEGLGPALRAGALLGAAAWALVWAVAPTGLLALGTSMVGLGVLYVGLGWWLVVLPDDRDRLRRQWREFRDRAS